MIDAAYLANAQRRYRLARAVELGCAAEDFDSHALTIADRPAISESLFVFQAVTFGTGTVVSIASDYREWVTDNAPEMHYRAMFPNVLLAPLAEEGKRRGEEIGWRSPNLSFIPGSDIAALPIPDGLVGRRVERDFHDAHVESGTFDNSLGDPGSQFVSTLWQYGFVLFDGETPAAVAGAYDDGIGLREIGVDVAREYRGRGLGPVVVTNLARLIRDEGCLPSYYCSPTNVRSHRNALSCGFVPVASGVRATKPRT